jgi:two-component system sensor histidine kinase BaeS
MRNPVRSLASRIALLSVGIAVITAVIAGALSIGLIHQAGAASARTTLARLADVAQSAADRSGNRVPAQLRLGRALGALDVRVAVVMDDGTLRTASPLARRSITHADIERLMDGQSVSATAPGSVFVEGRPTESGGVFLVQRRVDATAGDRRAIRRIVIALLVAGALAALLGLAVAARLARPLRRTAAGAHALAAGHRNVSVPAGGPTEVAEVGAAVNALAAALRQSEARQREFLLSVSHDLRTPLTAISGYAESLAGAVVPPEDTAQVGGVVLAEAKRLERLVGDLLDLARLGAQDFRVEPAEVDVGALVAETARVWISRCAAAEVPLHTELPSAPLLAWTDAGRLRQAVDGLLENALRVTPAGAAIVLAARTDAGAAVVEVRDGGPGLSDDDLAVAFEHGELYRRYRGVRQVGTGLGLAIVHGLVGRLGGTVSAGHAPEGGACFTVRLPSR